jgi:hypothetical protein
MPQPTQTDVHVDSVLTNISVAFQQDAARFVAPLVFPSVPVSKQSDKYYTYSQADFFRDTAQVRADSTESAGSGYSLSTSTYSSMVYALHKDIGDQVRANSDNPLAPDADATRYISQQMMIKQERDWATNFFAGSIWGTDVTPGTLWSASGSTPIADVETGMETVLTNTGMLPNTLVISYAVFSQLKNNADIIDRFKYTSSESITTDILARLFGVDRVLVMSGIHNSAAEGATAAYSQIGGKDALLVYSAPSASLLSPTGGYNFTWTGLSQSGGIGSSTAVSRFRMDHLRSDRIEIQSAWDFQVVSSSLGYFFDNVVA